MIRSTLFLVVFCVFFVGLSAQISITADDMPAVGDTFRASVAISAEGVDYTTPGEDMIWDFSALGYLGQEVDTFVSVSSTPFLYQLVFVYPLVSNMAKPASDIDFIPGLNIEESYEFYKLTDESFSNRGFATSFNELPIPLKYNEPDYLFRFPMEYGDIDSSESSFSVGLPGLGFYSTERKRVNHVDSWGTLDTPYGSFETIRVCSHLMIHDSIYIDSISFGFPINRSITEYKWLAKEMGVPVLEIAEEGPSLRLVYLDTIRQPMNVKEYIEKESLIEVWPNPSTDYINLSANLSMNAFIDVDIFDMSGSKHDSFKKLKILPGNSIKLPILDYPSGVYFIKSRIAGKLYIKKIVKI